MSSCVLYDMHKLYLYNYPKSNFNSHLTFVGSYFSIATARFRRLSIASGIFSTINDSAFTPDFDLLFIDSLVMYISHHHECFNNALCHVILSYFIETSAALYSKMDAHFVA